MPTMGLFQANGTDLSAVEGDTDAIAYGSGMRAGHGEQVIASGSPVNGPANATFGQTVSVFKDGFGTGNARGGEIDGLYVVVRQDQRDGVKADACGILVDAGFYDVDSFTGLFEGATSKFSKTNHQIVQRLVVQLGCMDHATSSEIALFGAVEKGEATAGLKLQANYGTGAHFQRFIDCHNGAFSQYVVDANGVVSQASPAGEYTAVRTNNGGTRAWLNHPGNVELMTLNQSGDLNVHGSIRVQPRTSAPPALQGRVWQDAYTGKLKVCEDGVNWRTIQTA